MSGVCVCVYLLVRGPTPGLTSSWTRALEANRKPTRRFSCSRKAASCRQEEFCPEGAESLTWPRPRALRWRPPTAESVRLSGSVVGRVRVQAQSPLEEALWTGVSGSDVSWVEPPGGPSQGVGVGGAKWALGLGWSMA